MNHPAAGISYLFAGFGLITQSGLRRYVVMPVLINVILFVGLFWMLSYWMASFNTWFDHFLPAWLQWLNVVFWLLFVVSFMLVFVFTFATFANMIAAPFNSLLAEKVEYYLTGKVLEPRGLVDNLKDVPRVILRQLAIVWYFLPRALVLLILFVVPLVQLVAAPLWFLFNAWLMALTYLDYPFDNHRISFDEMCEWMRARRSASLGFGMSVLVASMIPFVNFMVMPAAVAGGVKFWIDQRRQ